MIALKLHKVEEEMVMYLLNKEFKIIESAWANNERPEFAVDYENAVIQSIVKQINQENDKGRR